MLISKPKSTVQDTNFSELQKVASQFLPKEQVYKFKLFPHLIELELENEAREPEVENTIKDLFNALHERNTPKLLKVLQGDKTKIFYAFKKQLEKSDKLTKQQARVLERISHGELSLLTISTIK